MAQRAVPGLGLAGGAVHKAGMRGRARRMEDGLGFRPSVLGHRARRDGTHPSEARSARKSRKPYAEAPPLRTPSMGDTTARNGGD